jgi:nicotinamide riboside transporter PnuC
MLSWPQRGGIVALVLVLAFVWGWLMSMMGTKWFVGYFPANPLPYLDCCVTVLILTAQTLSALKKWDCWIAWLFVNIANLTLYLKAGLVFMPIVSCLYLVNGIWSLFTWYRLYRNDE